MHTDRLKMITAYWCNCVVGQYEQRFFWAYEQIDEIVHEVGEDAHFTLLALSRSAPGEYAESCFAAGPLEDYVNIVNERELSNEAAFLARDPVISGLFESVWSDTDKLKSLAAQGKSINTGDIDFGLRALDPKELMAFWCNACVYSRVDDYQESYEKVITKLLHRSTRESVKNDLLRSAPDEQAKEFLESNIFLLQD